MFTRTFWKDTAERVVSTAAQAAILAIGADQFNALEADFVTVAGFAAGGAVLAFLKAFAASKVGVPESASFSVGAIDTDPKKSPHTEGHK